MTRDFLDRTLASLESLKWAQTSNEYRASLLDEIADATLDISMEWVTAASKHKGIAAGSNLTGEEWFAGPASVIACCRQIAATIKALPEKAYLDELKTRQLKNGKLVVTVTPYNVFERILFMGTKADVWMQKGVNFDNLAENTARAYDIPVNERTGKIALVLGAGNVSSIAPLDCLHKLFCKHQAVILKLNPVNDYLFEFLQAALHPLIKINALRIVKGDGEIGAYLCEHPAVDEIHITGAAATHDAIVWGTGEEGERNKANGEPRLKKPISSELGGVTPTIVVPGPWSERDIAYHAEHIATQKLNNAGFNCIAAQMLIMSLSWDKSTKLLKALERAISKSQVRALYYPGAEGRISDFRDHAANSKVRTLPGGLPVAIARVDEDDKSLTYFENTEVFAPALSVKNLDTRRPEEFLKQAIDYCNKRLSGTLGANIIIHPNTIKEIGRERFEEILCDLRYGSIAINGWVGMVYGLVRPPWGAIPGHTLDDVQSGIGTVHNTLMFDRPERTVVELPFRSKPKPAWFIGNQRAGILGQLVTEFLHTPSYFKVPKIIWNALRG